MTAMRTFIVASSTIITATAIMRSTLCFASLMMTACECMWTNTSLECIIRPAHEHSAGSAHAAP